MKSITLLLAVMLMSITMQAQTAATSGQRSAKSTLVAKSASTATSAESLTKNATRTGESFEASDGGSYDVWKSAKGSLFIVRKSKKSGNYYKQYLQRVNE